MDGKRSSSTILDALKVVGDTDSGLMVALDDDGLHVAHDQRWTLEDAHSRAREWAARVKAGEAPGHTQTWVDDRGRVWVEP